MDLLSGIGWFWRALLGRSITFAALFALAILGFSATRGLRRVLDRADAPWLIVLVVPMLLVALLAKKEVQWVPDPARRLKWARGLMIGSVVLAILIAMLRPEPPATPGAPGPERPVRHGHPAR